MSLGDVVEDRPLEQGLAELVTYLSLEDPGFEVVLDAERTDEVRWTTDDTQRVATVPRITFARRGTAPPAAPPGVSPAPTDSPAQETP